MPQPKNAMEVFQLLDKSNCRECGEKTCLAFAGAVYRGMKKIDECPRLAADIVARFSDDTAPPAGIEENRDEFLEQLKREVAKLDFSEAAERTGGRRMGDKLTVKILGKDFSVDTQGQLSADIHVNPWVAGPFLNYVLQGKGHPVSGKWLSFRELKDGRERYPLFERRCEQAMKRIADSYPEFFDDIVHLFGGKKVAEEFESDISVVLYPLPKIPIMICYWMPEDGIESSLNLFFDESANDNLDIGSLFSLGAGLTQMFEKLSLRHGFQTMAR
jgi:hypothetical protein